MAYSVAQFPPALIEAGTTVYIAALGGFDALEQFRVRRAAWMREANGAVNAAKVQS